MARFRYRMQNILTVKEKLERDMQDTKIEISLEEWFDYMIAKERTTDKYEQMGIPGIE